MTKLLLALVAVMISLAAAPSVHARNPEPIINYEKVTWPRSDKIPLGLNEIRARISQAAQDKGWSIAPGTTENTLISTLVVRNKHTVKVVIGYDTTSFNVTYQDSINMKHGIVEPSLMPDPLNPGQEKKNPYEVIHPFYNDWVKTLVNSIQAQLQK